MSYDLNREKYEAIKAGENALRSLRFAKSDLDSARGWGIFDMLGGGFLSTALKQSKMSDARRNIEQAKWDLQTFNRELQDVSYITGTDFGIGDFAIFADFFFDGFIADFYVQSKINRARSQIDEAIRRVENILLKLK